MPIEIDEAEYKRLAALNGFANNILKNPEAAKLLEKAAKMVDPNVKTPRLDQEAVIAQPIEELNKTVAQLQKQIEDDKAEQAKNRTLETLSRQRNEGFAQLRAQGYLDTGIEAVEKLMEAKGILDPLDAAAIYERSHPPQVPSNPTGTGAWNFMDSVSDDSDKDLQKLIETKGDSDILADQMARKALNEVRQSARR